MTEYPVHYAIEHPERFSRLQLLVRVVAFWALGLVGLSFGTVFLFVYLALPVLAASRLVGREPTAYLDHDGPRIVDALSWLAALAAWVGLIADRLPVRAPNETVKLEIERTAHPTPSAVILRVVSGLPSALVLALLGCVGVFVWLWAALSILITERVGPVAFDYLVGLQRWSIRLLAYQASLVDEYPPFSFIDTPPALPTAGVTA
jgi:hypothetical protein